MSIFKTVFILALLVAVSLLFVEANNVLTAQNEANMLQVQATCEQDSKLAFVKIKGMMNAFNCSDFK